MIPTEDIIPIVKKTIAASIKCNTHRGYIGWSSCDNICMDIVMVIRKIGIICYTTYIRQQTTGKSKSHSQKSCY